MKLYHKDLAGNSLYKRDFEGDPRDGAEWILTAHNSTVSGVDEYRLSIVERGGVGRRWKARPVRVSGEDGDYRGVHFEIIWGAADGPGKITDPSEGGTEPGSFEDLNRGLYDFFIENKVRREGEEVSDALKRVDDRTKYASEFVRTED
jgi:hypothetical protein